MAALINLVQLGVEIFYQAWAYFRCFFRPTVYSMDFLFRYSPDERDEIYFTRVEDRYTASLVKIVNRG